MGRVVIAAYRPKAGMENALLQLTKEHVPILRGQGLVTDRVPIAMRSTDGTIVEVFEWKSQAAIDAAHSNPEVLKMWKWYEQCCDYVKLNTVPETDLLFAVFEPVDL